MKLPCSIALIVSFGLIMTVSEPSELVAQQCNTCHPCAGGYYTSGGASPWPILYLDDPHCQASELGCDGLIPCQGGADDEDIEDALAALESGNRRSLDRLTDEHPDALEFVSSRGVVLVKRCAKVVAVKPTSAQLKAYFLDQ